MRYYSKTEQAIAMIVIWLCLHGIALRLWQQGLASDANPAWVILKILGWLELIAFLMALASALVFWFLSGELETPPAEDISQTTPVPIAESSEPEEPKIQPPPPKDSSTTKKKQVSPALSPAQLKQNAIQQITGRRNVNDKITTKR